jgi:hypothetical protein
LTGAERILREVLMLQPDHSEAKELLESIKKELEILNKDETNRDKTDE